MKTITKIILSALFFIMLQSCSFGTFRQVKVWVSNRGNDTKQLHVTATGSITYQLYSDVLVDNYSTYGEGYAGASIQIGNEFIRSVFTEGGKSSYNGAYNVYGTNTYLISATAYIFSKYIRGGGMLQHPQKLCGNLNLI